MFLHLCSAAIYALLRADAGAGTLRMLIQKTRQEKK